MGTTAVGRQGLGASKTTLWKKADVVERRTLVQKEIRSGEEERRQTKAVELGVQGAWTRWDTEPRVLSWTEIWKYPQFQLQFFLRSVYDVLPTPANLHRWDLAETPDCPLCVQRGTLQHILTSCHVALAQGRYTWRHNEVLRELADILEKERKNTGPINQGPFIHR
ncbi:uncharacterized protein [Argopecten irradians]|uniref:uncharacterized protein n=1 Tax=Argopecten irradians TaxID=31199 RepID=UPI003722C3A1